MAVDLETIAEIRIEASMVGDGDAVASAARLGAAIDGVTVKTDNLTKTQIRANNALETAARKHDAEYRALSELAKINTVLERARAQGLSTTEAYGRVQENVTNKLRAQADAAKIATDAQNRLAIAAKAQAQINGLTGVREGGDYAARSADIAAYGKEMDSLRAKYDPLFKVQRAYRLELTELQTAYRTGAIPSQEVYAAALDRLKTSFADQIRGLKGVKDAQESVAVSAVKTAAQVRGSWAALGAIGSSTLANIQASNKLGSMSNGSGTVADDSAQDRARLKYDEVFAAATRYRAALAELRSDLANGAITEDLYTSALARKKTAFAEQVRELNGMADAQRRNSAEAVNSAAAAKVAQAAEEARARALREASAKLSGLNFKQGGILNDKDMEAERAALIPLVAAQQQYEQQVLRVNQAVARGVITDKERVTVLANARSTLLNQTNEVRKAEEANARLTKGVGLNAYAWQNLSFQVNDVVTSLASGISPFQTLAQQGGQIYQILQSGQGGVGGALTAIKDRLLAISPLVGVFGGLAAGAVLAAVAAYRFVAAQRDVELALLGAGRGAGLTGDQIQSIAEKASRTSEITVSGAREIEKAFLQTGKVYGEVFATGITAAENFSKTINGDRGKAAEFVASSLANLGGGGYEELAKKAGNFDARLEDQVRTLLNAGKEMEAQMLVTERFGQAFDKAGEKLTGLQKTLAGADQWVKNLAESFGKTIATIGQPLPLQEQLERVESSARNRRAVAPEADTSDLEAQAKKLRDAMRQVGEDTTKEAAKVRQNVDVLQKGATNALVPQIAQIEQIRKQRAEANKELNALENSGGSAERIAAASKAVAASAQAERDYEVAGGAANIERVKAVEVMRAGLKAQQAVTPEEKAAAARQVVLADAFGTTTSSQERTAKANDAYKKSLAEQRIASDNSSRAMNESTKTSNEVAAASVKAGKSIEYLSAARKVDEQIANGSNNVSASDRDKKIDEELKSRLGAINQQTAERVRSAQQQATAQQSVNDKVAAGKMVAAEASRQSTLANDVAKLAIERDAASGEQKAILTQRIGELTAATQAQFSAEDRLKVLGLGEEEQRRIDLLQKEISLQGESVEVRARELAIMQAKQGLERQGISTTAPESVSYLNKVALRTDLDTAKSQYERLAADISGVVSGIFDDMFSKGNKGIAGFADSFSKGFARIGSRMIEQNLIAPLLGGNGGVAGGANGFGSLFKMFDSDKIEKAVSTGASDGIGSTLGELLKPKAGGGFATSKLGGGLIAAGAGAAIGYQSQSPLTGALGGALSGFAATGNPVGALVGGAAGLLGGLFGKSQAEKERQAKIKEQARQDAETYKAALPQINMLSRTFRGEGTGSVTEQSESAFQQMYQANVTASKGGDQARANELVKEYEGFRERLRMGFMSSFQGIYAEMSKGLGQGGPFAQAAAAVMQLGEGLKGFVADTKNILNDEGFTRGAQAAARESALASLETPKTLSAIETEFGRINGTASGLKRVLMDLGLSAEDAATAISERTTKAMDALRGKFNGDLDTKINENTGKGYLNEAADFMKEIQGLRVDRGIVGGDAGKLEAYFASGAQKIVNEASLTGAAFEEFARLFPEFQGRIVEFSETLVQSAEDIAAAAEALAERQRGYQDRTFAANNDASTEAGALAAFDRAAAQERIEEAKLGGKAMADLEQALAAERLGIVRDFATTAAKEAQEAADAIAGRLRGFADRAFSAGNDTSTIMGSLAAFDRQAERERTDEVKAGGQAIAALEEALSAERLGIITSFAQKAADSLNTRLRGYGDRLFSAGNDNSTLTGQLAAFDRQAQREREQEIAAGGEAIADLEATLYAERAKIVTTFSQQAIEAERQRIEAAQTAYDAFARNIKQFVDGLRAGSGSPLSPQARLAAAQSQYNSQLTAAQGGDRTALDGITSYASDLLEAAKGFYASSGQFQTIFNQVTGQLTALPTQVSPEQFIVNAIDSSKSAIVTATQAMQAALLVGVRENSPTLVASALNANFNRLDTSVNGLLDYNELLAGLGPVATKSEQTLARTIFSHIDTNGDGQISKLEAVRATNASIDTSTESVNRGVAASNSIMNTQATLLDQSRAIMDSVRVSTASSKLVLDSVSTSTAASKLVLDSVSASTAATNANVNASNSIMNTQATLLDRQNTIMNGQTNIFNQQSLILDAVNNQSAQTTVQTSATKDSVNAGNGVLNAIRTLNDSAVQNNAQTNGHLIKILFNLQSANIKAGANPYYAVGGLVTGPGTGTSDSISARLSNGEFVMRAEAVRRMGVANLDALNDNRMSMAAAVVPMMSATTMSGGMDGNSAAEIKALREELKAALDTLVRVTAAGAEHVGDRVDGVKDSVDEGRRNNLLVA